MRNFFWIVLVLSPWSLGFAAAPASKATLVQMTAEISGQLYKAQLATVEYPDSKQSQLIVNDVSIVYPEGRLRRAEQVVVQSRPANQLGMILQSLEPFQKAERLQAVNHARASIEQTRLDLDQQTARQVQAFPSYGTYFNKLYMQYGPPGSGANAEAMSRLREGAIARSQAAFQGIQQEMLSQQMQNENFQQHIAAGQQITVALQKNAVASSVFFNASLMNFAAQNSQAYQHDVFATLDQIVKSDPKIENIVIPPGDSQNGKDDEFSKVSPLNPHSKEYIAQNSSRFRSNGLLKEGVFADNNESFAATANGHRLQESANLLSDVVLTHPTLSQHRSTQHLIGASYVYINAALRANSVGQSDKSEEWTEKGRRIARALRGENLPADLERAVSSSAAAIELHVQSLRDVFNLSGSPTDVIKSGLVVANPSTPMGAMAKDLGQRILENASTVENQKTALLLLDVALGFVPVVGPTKSLVYMAAGKNLLTGEDLTAVDYVLCSVDVLSLGTSNAVTKAAKHLPDIYGAAYKGSKQLLAKGWQVAEKFVGDYKAFVVGSVDGLRQIEKASPGFIAKNLISSPGQTLALGQSVSKYGGEEFAQKLVNYSKAENLSLTETAHVAQFGEGFTKFVKESDWIKYGNSPTLAGANGRTMFASSTTEINSLASPTSQEIGQLLNLDLNPGERVFRFDIPFDTSFKPRIPTGNEAGANEFFQSGGKTASGALEVALEPVPMNLVKPMGLLEP